MKSSTISGSNSIILSLRDWIITIVLIAVISALIYNGWFKWERFNPGKDYRVTCWAERESDYWAFARWSHRAGERYNIFLIGDSVIWGQETRLDETISHYLNECLGDEIIANIGIDGLHMAGINGMVKYYGKYLDNKNIILQFNPLWMSSEKRDLRGEGRISYHHPRLIPQLSFRINYNQPLEVRVGYLFDHFLRLPILVRHLMVNYFNNKSIANWMMDNPYRNPFSAITFTATPVMAEKQGKGIDWKAKGMEISDSPFVSINESMQWQCYFNALESLKKVNARVFVLLGPYNTHALTPDSIKRLKSMIGDVKKSLDDSGILYFDSMENNLPSDTFGDSCHLLKDGHLMLARNLMNDTRFREWLKEKKIFR
ncbi:hypothetical protein ACFL1R_00420 [Candidatus Latescibacterota bacterium]